MRMALATATLGMFGALAPASAPENSAATATGPWQVGQKPGVCLGMRDYIVEGRSLTLTLRPQMVGRDYSLGFVDGRAQLVIGEATVSVSAPGGFKFSDKGNLAPSPDQPGLATFVTVPRAAVATVAHAAEITITANGKSSTFSSPDFSPISTVLQQCRATQFQKFGIDLAAVDAVAIPPAIKPDVGKYFDFGAYPPAALRNREQGRVVTWLTISAVGKVTDCRVLQSSGSTTLDTGTCTIGRAKARFIPAKDKAGNAIVGYFMLPVNWAIP